MKRLSKHLNPATIIAVAALVFAMSGGAYALGTGNGPGSGDHAVASAAKKNSKGAARKKKGNTKTRRGPRGRRGPEGKQGPAGAPGPAGAKGDTGLTGPEGKEGKQGKEGIEGKEGEPGTPGTPGQEGESVTVNTLNAGEGGCTEGGAEFSNASGSATACNGKAAGGTLEAEQVEEGTWSMEFHSRAWIKEFGEGKNYALHTGEAAITFPEPLPAADFGRVTVYFVSAAEAFEKTGTTECPAYTNASETVPGTLCIYANTEEPALEGQLELSYAEPKEAAGYYTGNIEEGLNQGGGAGGKYQIGALIEFMQAVQEPEPTPESAGGYASGVWILTAPEEI